jgi:uncharacterized membrane protein
MPSSVVFMILSLWFYPEKRSVGFYSGMLSLILLVVTLLVTLLVLVPIDNDLKEWTISTIPPDWEAIRDKWDVFHSVRTITSLTSFGCFAISVIFSKNRFSF